jgi:DNA-binding beta-propeller fold protein YncE
MTDASGEASPPLGSEFAGHLLESVLGRGGMGIVYRARNVALDRVRALKVLAPSLSADERFRERFRRESRLAASIEHPNVIPVHQAGEEEGHLYLSMRLVEGRDLREVIIADGPLAPDAAAEIVASVAGGLDAAHHARLIHRDVKPANVLVGEGEDAGRVYLTDFGISRAVGGGETVTGTGELVGTADFVSPEQISGDPVDYRADIYALGGVLYFILTGRPPFARESELATLFAHANAPRPSVSEARPDLPPALDRVIATAMAIRPDDRYGSAGELAAALQTALGADAPPARPIESGPEADEAETRPLTKPPDGRRRWWIPAAVAAAVAGLVIFLLARDSGDAGDAPEVVASAPIDVAAGPTALAVGPSRAWVASTAGDHVDGISLATNEIEFPIRVAAPKGAVVAHDSVWTVSKQTDRVLRLDPLEDVPPLQIDLPAGSDPVDVAADSRWVWVAEEGEQDVIRIDPEANAVDAERVRLGTPPRALAVGEGSVWVTNVREGSVSRIDPDDAVLANSAIDVGPLPNDIAVGEGAVWVTSFTNGTVSRIDPDTNSVSGEPIEVGARPRGVAAGLGYVWVVLGGDGTLVRIDPGTNEMVGDPIEIGPDPSDVAVGEDSVWVTSEAESTATRLNP